MSFRCEESARQSLLPSTGDSCAVLEAKCYSDFKKLLLTLPPNFQSLFNVMQLCVLVPNGDSECSHPVTVMALPQLPPQGATTGSCCPAPQALGTSSISTRPGSCTELMAPFLQIKVTGRPLLAFPQQQDRRSGQPARSGKKQQESSTGPRATR